MEASSAIVDLIKAQGACDPVFKDATNPHFKSKYASLSSCVDACKEAFHNNNFAVLQANGHDAYGQFVETTLLHTTGASWSSVVYLVLQKNDMQGLGSAITYARRYGILGMVGLAPEDDDGNAASIQAARPQPAPRPQPKPPEKPKQKAEPKQQAPGLDEPPIQNADEWRIWVDQEKRKIEYFDQKYQLSKWAKDSKSEREALAEYDREMTAELKDYYAAKFETLNTGVR